MSSEQTISTSDLRSAAQDYKRDATRKHKWALGAVAGAGRAPTHPRPHRPAETIYSYRRKWENIEIQRSTASSKAKMARKQDMLDEGEEYPVTEFYRQRPSEEFSTDDEEDNAEDEESSVDEDPDTAAASVPMTNIPIHEVMYSFDAPRAPSQGSQILNTALAKAIEKYEDKETSKLVKNEYDLVEDGDDDVVGTALTAPATTRVGKGKGRRVNVPVDVPKSVITNVHDAEDRDEYEFV